MYRCLCGAAFERPAKKCETARHGGGMRERGFILLCPLCGLKEPYFEEEKEENEHLRN